MLVEDKFYFISLPRCASTSFMASCVKNNLKIKHLSDRHNIENQLKFIDEIDYNKFQYQFSHIHEPIDLLVKRFGDQYDIISVKRDKYERFISLWKHLLHEVYVKEDKEIYQKCLKMDVNDILFYKSSDIKDDLNIFNTVETFIERNKLNNISRAGKNMIAILLKPHSGYHQHNSNIIWFDFNNLSKLEKWVSDRLSFEFKLLKINSSQHFDCNLSLNDYFKKKYDSIYEIYDEVKSKMSFI
jgi:hypothetical protein